MQPSGLICFSGQETKRSVAQIELQSLATCYQDSFKIYQATHQESVAASNLSPRAITTFFPRRKSANPLSVFAIRARTSAMRVSVAAGHFKGA